MFGRKGFAAPSRTPLAPRRRDPRPYTVLELEAGGYAEVATVVGDEAWESQTPVRATIVPSNLVD